MKSWFASLCLIPSLLWGIVFESGKMEEMIPHIDEETWVLIDLDNTLIESCQHLGSAQWRGHIRKKTRSLGYSEKDTELALDKFWVFVQHFTQVRLVDPHATWVIEQLKGRNTRVVALTARDFFESSHTQRQLSSVGVSFSSPDLPGSTLLPSDHLILLDEGVIYCGESTKSGAFLAFVKAMGKRPKKIIFIDDKVDQVAELKGTLEEMGIEFVGIRFSGADERVKAFDPDIADLQFSYLPTMISDEEARKLLTQ